MRLYTRTGDEGQTSLIGSRVNKDDIRVESYGTIDELNSFVGLAVTQLKDNKFEDIRTDLEEIQQRLFDCGGDLANVSTRRPMKMQETDARDLESKIDKYLAEAPKLEKFILPGGTEAAATLHIARTITRRAERLIIKLQTRDENVSPNILKFINRLSDYFFATARAVNYRSNVTDVQYENSKVVFREMKRKGNDNE